VSLENNPPQRSSLRSAIVALALSASGLVGIALNEGYSERAIIPVKGDVPTIGFGTTQGVKLGDRTTPPQALVRALKDVNRFEARLKQCVRVPLHQHEYDAYVGFSYNVGSGAFCDSRLVKKLNASDYPGACKELLRWTYFQGKNCARAENARLCGGLATRRQEEYRQCMGSNAAL
jgi:lysozyme